MNTRQYAKYFTDAYNTFFNNLRGEKYRNIELFGDSAAQIATNQMQVELQREESEKAYRRSSAPNQVALMTAAGMSRAGAINALNGGGSYTPAPISLGSPSIGSSASNVRQNDLATLSSAQDAINTMISNWQQHQQMKMQQKQFNATLAEEKRQFDAQYELQKEESRLKNKLVGEQIHDVIATYTGKGFDNAIKNIEYRIASANEVRRTSAEDAKYLAEEAQSALEALKAIKQTQAWSQMSPEQIAEYYELQAKLEILANLGNTKATDLLAKIISIF